ncbi:MAG: HlyD family secretion protein [Verrucomicrobia bacterium]|nr:HlyD family secretion protein [Verrucomicrobiota bacterium]
MDTKAGHSSKTSSQRRWLRRLLLLLGPVALLVGGLIVYLHGGRFVTSDNAYVRAEKLTVTSEVPGTVTGVAVHDNDHVAAGQLLFRIDDSSYRIAVEAAQARIDAVRVELATMRATYRERLAQVDEAREQAVYAEKELARQHELLAGKAGTEADLDRAEHALEAAQRREAVLAREAATALAALGGSAEKPDEDYARFAEAKARLDAATRDLGKTRILAPAPGVVANVTNIPVGRFLAAAQPALSLVETDQVWLEANLKETEVTHVRPGQPVDVEIDTYPGARWQGVVAAVGPATGAEFALIPPQNASGTWIKVVQRLPVRIELRSRDDTRPLRTGMSAEVAIDTGHQRTLRELLHGPAAGQP